MAQSPLFGPVAHYAFVSALSRSSQCGQETSEPLFRLFLSRSIAAYCLHSIVRSSSEGTLLRTLLLALSLRMCTEKCRLNINTTRYAATRWCCCRCSFFTVIRGVTACTFWLMDASLQDYNILYIFRVTFSNMREDEFKTKHLNFFWSCRL